MNKMKKILILLTVSIFIILFGSCTKQKDLNGRLDDLEKIIDKFEPKFKTTTYGTAEYTQMIAEYNKEIFEWADEFEENRYEKDGDLFKKDSEGKRIPLKEFAAVQSRFYELNNRMTRMVLAGIPKPEEPEGSEIITDEAE